MSVFTQQIEWDKELIKRYDLAGPRYTSYPTAPQFQESFTETALLNAIARSNQSQRSLSLYFHIPFCDSLCYYCGCNKVVTNNKSRSLPYIQRMIQELALYADLFDHQRHVKQLHWGGGTPTFINNEEMSLLMHATRRLFQLADDDQSEFSIEIHPGRVSTNTIGHLRELGFNRISMGVQDFDTRVQKAVNRYNTVEQVSELMRSMRAHNYQSVSMDLIYGLPLQTLASIKQTLSEIIELNPDRLSLFNYAHLPHLFKSQLLISDMELPSAVEKLDILHFSIQTLEAAGYIYIGMDHFAKPEDELVRAQRAGKLQRNFQGYSTHKDCDLIAVGASSISMIDNIYVQNAKELNTYQQKLDLGLLPITRGFSLNDEDVLRRSVINSLICHLHVDFKQLEQEFAIAPRTYFAAEIAQLNPLIEDGLLSIDEYGINVHNKGRLLIRRICMVFDEYLKTATNNIHPIRYSKII